MPPTKHTMKISISHSFYGFQPYVTRADTCKTLYQDNVFTLIDRTFQFIAFRDLYYSFGTSDIGSFSIQIEI